MALPVVDVTHVWTYEDLQQVPDQFARCYQILDGALIVSPLPHPFHEAVSARLLRIVAPQVPEGFEMVGALGIDLGASYLGTDLTVVSTRILRRDANFQVDPADAVLAVEVVSPRSVTMDRVLKPAKYAAGGTRAYWRVETDPVALTAYALSGDTYIQVGTWGAGETARLTQPFPVEIEIDRLG